MKDFNFESKVAQSIAENSVDVKLSNSSTSVEETASRPADGLRKQSGAGKRKLKPEEDPDGAAAETKRRRRTWEQWTVADKHIFFAALNMYGKDFDKIEDYFKNKMKNKQNVPLEFIKNKNQIRHFYYRSWHKITQYVNFEKALKASTKELFALINYGEIWKRIEGVINRNILMKLNELVHKGSVTIKHKGKTLRVKTPVCPILKRIHNKQNTGKQENLPSRVVIEIRPRHTTDWITVHNMAQNPVLKVTMGVQRKLISLLKHLKSKWRSREHKVFETLLSKGDSTIAAQAAQKQESELFLVPERGAEIKVPVIVPAPTITSSQISLQSMHEECQEEPVVVKSKLKVKLGDEETSVVKESNGNHNTEPGSRTGCVENCDKGVAGTMASASNMTANQHDSNSMPNLVSNFKDGKSSDVHPEDQTPFDGEDYINEDFDGENSQSPVPPAETESKEFVDDEKDNLQERDEGKDEVDGLYKKEAKVDLKPNLSNLKSFDPSTGWSVNNCGDTTIGEIYLMLAEENKTNFVLEYEWKKLADKVTKTEESVDNKDTKEKKTASLCTGVLSKLVNLSHSNSQPRGRGRQNSLTLHSPNVRTSVASPVSPAALAVSRTSPVSRGSNPGPGGRGVAKQLPLMSETAERTDNGLLAVPLEQETEFRKPIAPAPAVKPAPLNSVFHQQIGHYFPKFSNRRGRQNRSRMNNKFVGRQVVKPIQSRALQPIQTINMVTGTQGAVASSSTNRNIIITPSPIILSSAANTTSMIQQQASATGQHHRIPVANGTTTLVLTPVQSTPAVPQSILPDLTTPKSPPQISIPSPAMSPNPHIPQAEEVLSTGLPTIVTTATTLVESVISSSLAPPISLQPARTPSPTPSLSSLMDITFPDSLPATPKKQSSSDQFLSSMMDDSSLLNTPMRVTSPPSSEVNLSEDISLTSWSLSFDSPLKQSSLLSHSEDSQTSIISTNSEVDRQLTAMMNENSIDFTSTFRQLAKHVTSERENNS